MAAENDFLTSDVSFNILLQRRAIQAAIRGRWSWALHSWYFPGMIAASCITCSPAQKEGGGASATRSLIQMLQLLLAQIAV